MKAKVFLFLSLLLGCLAVLVNGESVYVSRLFADCYQYEDFILVDDTSKVDELKRVVIISRDGRYREEHGIKHVYDGRAIYLTERLRSDFYSGARIYQDR